MLTIIRAFITIFLAGGGSYLQPVKGAKSRESDGARFACGQSFPRVT